MKVLTILGISQSGKTTTAEYIIRELRRRGYTVGSVKDIHFEGFEMDVEGTNTYRHKLAGSQLVTARGKKETDILFQETLPIERILGFYDQDYVILEGDSGADAPKIITAHSTDEIDERMDERVIAISGQISNKLTAYKGIPVFNAMTNIEDFVDFIEDKIGDYPTVNLELFLNGEKVKLKPFIQNMIANMVIGSVKELKGYEEQGEILIRVKGSSKLQDSTNSSD